MNKQFLKKLGFTILVVTILQMGQQILIPQLNESMRINILNSNPLIRVVTTVTGAQYAKPTLFSIGMGPYMLAMIVFSALQALGIGKKWTAESRDIAQRIVTLIFATLQSIQMISILKNGALQKGGAIDSQIILWSAVLVLVAGAMLVSWLGNMNTAYGLGGLGIMIVPGIISMTIQSFTGNGRSGLSITQLAWLLGLTLLFVIITEFFNHAELRIPLQHVLNDSVLTKSYLPIKVLLPGVMPLMFSMVVLQLFPLLLGLLKNKKLLIAVSPWFSTANWRGVITYAIVIALLGYMFSYMNLTPHNFAEQMQKSGDYFWRVVPGKPTEQFLKKKMHVMIFIGNLFAITIACVPYIVGFWYPMARLYSMYFVNLYMMITILDNVVEQVRGLYVSSHYELI